MTCFISETRFKYGNNVTVTNDNAKNLFGFHALPFRPLQRDYSTVPGLKVAVMFPSVIIFTPNQGLFNDTPPPN